MSAVAAFFRCSRAPCDFETESHAELEVHLAQSSSNETRWQCQGTRCEKIYCTTEAFEGEDGHFETCKPLQKWAKKRKYGKKMSERITAKCEVILEGTGSAGVDGGTSKRKREDGAIYEERTTTIERSAELRKSIGSRRKVMVISGLQKDDAKIELGKESVEGDDSGVGQAAGLDDDASRVKGSDAEANVKVSMEAERKEPETQSDACLSRGGDGQDKRVRFCDTSPAEADAAVQDYGCTLCHINFTTLRDAQDHVAQSNRDMGHYVCMGCNQAFCESEKHLVRGHIRGCAQLKIWMSRQSIAWPRHLDEDFIDMVNQSYNRREVTKHAARVAKATTLKVSQVQSLSTQATKADPESLRAIWNGSNWFDFESKDLNGGELHDHRRAGFMYRPGTFITIPTTAPPYVACANQEHDDPFDDNDKEDEDIDNGIMFGYSLADG